jgi:chromate transporter
MSESSNQTPASGPATLSQAAVPSLAQALRFWCRLGFISFGGPAGQIALMHDELVTRRRWISERRFLHALNYCMLLPGPEAQQLATYLGWLMHRTWGGIAAGVLFVLPSLFILVALSWVYLRFGQVGPVAAVFWGLKPAVTALVLQAAWRMGTRTLHNRWLVALAVAAFVALTLADLPFPVVVGVALAAGGLGARWKPEAFSPRPAVAAVAVPAASAAAQAPGHAPTTAPTSTSQGQGAALAAGGTAASAACAPWLDDDTPAPPHARFSSRRLASVVVVALTLWALGLGVLAAVWGWDGVFTRMASFFTQAALVTFGGAYAVLPFVVQGAVEQQGWLTAPQMIDGLALGETTPGPLIMVVAFVGFLGGWQKEVLGPDALWAAGVLGACVATFFTFLPSFLFILAGGPLVEATRGRLGFTAPLTAVTAAVVGVIASLALFFATHTLWPAGLGGPLDLGALALAAAAALALMRFKVGTMKVLLACALAGCAAHLLGLRP